MTHPTIRPLLPVLVLGLSVACDEKKPAPEPAASVAAASTEEEPEPEAPAGPPSFEIDSISPKVGFSRILLDKPDGAGKLKEALDESREHIAGKDLVLSVDRKAKLAWVQAFLDGLAQAEVGSLKVRTETRDEYPKELKLGIERQATDAAGCSTVAMVLADRSTAVWKVSGGVASRRQKGMAGPDLSMTGETLERFGKSCKDSDKLFFAADPDVEWGLAYDLAASSQTLKKSYFQSLVLLKQTPVPGHKVELSAD